MRVAVIGAGVSGLAAVKYSKEAKLDVVCFEQTNNIGGTWVYSENIGRDKHGLKIHSSMYQNLHTNLPKETMGYHDFKFTGFERSYVSPKEMMNYLESYADHFGLRECIKFEHHVTKVEPLSDDKWSISTLDLVKDEQVTGMFDAVFICNGHYSTPNMPEIEGIENFKGKVIHSHDYRYPEAFRDQKVLVIGAGPSGIDISMDVQTTAQFVGFSHHLPKQLEAVYDTNVTQLPDVAQILDDGRVLFENKEAIEFDTIIYCTGYKYVYPFLSPECQIRVDNNHVTQLYKHIININYPTMYFIGLPFVTVIVPLLDIQVRFCMQFLTKVVPLPSKEEMLEDFQEDIRKRQLLGYKKSKMHMLGKDFMDSYFKDLAEIAKIDPVKPVIFAIYHSGKCWDQKDMKNYRKYNYRIIDDNNFVKTFQE